MDDGEHKAVSSSLSLLNRMEHTPATSSRYTTERYSVGVGGRGVKADGQHVNGKRDALTSVR